MKQFVPEGAEGLKCTSTVREIRKVGRVVSKIIVPFLGRQIKSETNQCLDRDPTSSGHSPIHLCRAQSTAMPTKKKTQYAALRPCSRVVPQLAPLLTHRRSQTFAQDSSGGLRSRAIDWVSPNAPVEAVHIRKKGWKVRL